MQTNKNSDSQNRGAVPGPKQPDRGLNDENKTILNEQEQNQAVNATDRFVKDTNQENSDQQDDADLGGIESVIPDIDQAIKGADQERNPVN